MSIQPATAPSGGQPHYYDEGTVLRVAGGADVKQLAAAISFAVGDNKRVTLRAIGASAVNQAVKAAAIARGYVASRGVDLVIRPGFTVVGVPGATGVVEDRNAIVLIVSVG